MKENNNKIAFFNDDLNTTNRIVVKTKRGYSPKKKAVIKDKNEIEFLLLELNNIKETPFVLLECPYRAYFYSSGYKKRTLDLYLDLEYPDSSFVRYRTKDDMRDYIISQNLYEFFVAALDLKK